MTDRELAKRLVVAADVLNDALKDAADAGLKIGIDIHGFQRINEAHERQMVRLKISRETIIPVRDPDYIHETRLMDKIR
jgi:hypothetical protein